MNLFKKDIVQLRDTRAFESILLDYIGGNDSLKKYYSYSATPENFKLKAADRAKIPVNRKLLVDVIRDQYAALPGESIHPAVKKNLEKLLAENSFTVTTGHQLNIFSGPLYFIYKIISTINLAAKLEHEQGISVLPVYWMASEDHDMAEIDHVKIFGQVFQWKNNWKGAAGKASCDGLPSTIEEIASRLGDSANAKEIIGLLKDAYKPERTLSEATRHFVNALFGEYGLIILDPDDARLKTACSKLFLDDLLNNTAYSKVEETCNALSGNYKIQVHPRPINLFYLGNNFRERIVKDGEKYSVLNSSEKWTYPELEKEVHSHPEHFSPNVVLRPMYQELILPNLAMVGGPAEIAYWLEYKSAFDFYQISFPILIMRCTALVIDAATWSKLNKFKISVNDLFMTYDEWSKKYLMNNEENSFSLQNESMTINKEFERIALRIEKIDPSLKASLEAEKQRVMNSLLSIEEKVLRAFKKKNEVALNQLQKLKIKLFPDDSMQERVENLLPFYEQFGKEFISELMKAFVPIDPHFIVLSPIEIS